MKAIAAIPNWALGGAAIALGGAALYLYFRGSKGVAKDAVGVVSGAVSGTIEGMGDAFQDVTQATFGLPKTNVSECQAALDRGDTWTASYKCAAGTFIKSLFSSEPVVAKDVQTAPGGGLWSPSQSTFSSIFSSPNDGSGWSTFENPYPNPVPGSVPSGFLPVDYGYNYAPTLPVKITGVTNIPVNEWGSTSLFPVAGLRG